MLPLTLVVGFYGMNGLDLNNLSSLPSGFTIVMISMVIITGALFYLFIKKKWIKIRGNKVLPEKNEKEG